MEHGPFQTLKPIELSEAGLAVKRDKRPSVLTYGTELN
jgi:hypothetical protein